MKELPTPPQAESQAALHARLQQVSSLLGNGQLPQALRAAEAGMQAFPRSADLCNLAGICAINLGDTAQAEHYWRQAIALDPTGAQAHFNLGLLNANLQRNDQAEYHYRQAIALDPANAAAHSNLGALLSTAQRPDEAEQCYRQAIAVNPSHAMAYFNLGLLLAERQRDSDAEQCFRQTLAVDPRNALAHFHLGLLLAKQQRNGEAEQCYRRTLALDPGNAPALFNLGVLLAHAKRDAEAEQCYHQILQRDPTHALAYTNLGILLAGRHQSAEAERCYRRAIALNPDAVEAYNNLGLLLEDLQRRDEAEHCYRQVIQRNPHAVITLSNLALLLVRSGREEEAEACFHRALAQDPAYAVARLNLGFLLLRQGRFAEGWRLHEARLDPSLPEKNRHPCPITATFPQWQGEPLTGKRLLVWPEQGLGDEIQFCRYLPLLKQQGAARLTLVCKAPLQPLLETLEGVDEVIALDESNPVAPPHDHWTYPLSLPLHCKTTLDTVPARLPYLHALPERVARWSARLPRDGFRLGLVWKGSRGHSNDRNRSLPGLKTLAPLWSVPGVSFVSLQKGQGEDEAKTPPAGQPLLDLGSAFADFADTAAVIEQLDLIISVDTAVVHLAGALAKPCWVLLPADKTDWRWLEGRDDSPWYPKIMRLFRQDREGDWTTVVERLKAALSDIKKGTHLFN